VLSLSDLVQDYGDPQAEAMCCRQNCALFDFSFVYRIRVSGRDSITRIEQFQPRTVSDMAIGQIRYSVKLNVQGRVRSDLTLWRYSEDVFEIMSGCAEDISDLCAQAGEEFNLLDLSESTAILSLQGPNTLTQLARFMDVTEISTLPYFHFARAKIGELSCLIGRLGYSGEAGFEILVDQSGRDWLWDLLSTRFPPAGFAAIDILRIEAGFFLFTNECRISPSISELGLSALLEDRMGSPEIKLVAFEGDCHHTPNATSWQPTSSEIRRPDSGEIMITSACFSPLFNRVIGLGFVKFGQASDAIIDPKFEFLDVKLCSLPPYDPHKTRPRKLWQADIR
jgi:glycine cleavage system aminomethyltransferase T